MKLTPNLPDFRIDFHVEWEIEKGEAETRDVPRTDDHISITKVFVQGKESNCDVLKAHLESEINSNPEILGVEMVDGVVIR